MKAREYLRVQIAPKRKQEKMNEHDCHGIEGRIVLAHGHGHDRMLESDHSKTRIAGKY